MGTKVLVIGIDALDAELVEAFEDSLPNIKELKAASTVKTIHSVIPPDSDTAWATIYTGLNPAMHGIVQYVDPLEKSISYVSKDIDNQEIVGRTFWDTASSGGKRVCIILPHIGFPTWEVNGVMVARSSILDEVDAFPADLETAVEFSSLNVPKGMPSKNLNIYAEKNRKLLAAQQAVFLEMLEREEWDLFFGYTSILDMVKHYFWSYYDQEDPAYPGKNPYEDVIKEFYILHDEMVGKMLEKVGSDTTVILLSDHGHGMRPVEVININEMLRRKGLLVLKEKSIEKNASMLVDKVKGLALSIISKYQLGKLASKLLKFMPWARRLYSSPIAIDWDRTIAFATNLSGIKAYSYSGVMIQKQNLGELDYEDVRQMVIEELSNLTHPETGQRYLKFVERREKLYSGPYLEKYPDLVFELQYRYGVGLTTDNKLYGLSNSHHLVPGSHRADTAVFYISNARKGIARQELGLVDVAPTILDCLGMPVPEGLDGESILERQEASL